MSPAARIVAGMAAALVTGAAACAAPPSAPGQAMVRVELSVPDTAWSVSIDEVYDAGTQLVAVCRLHRPDDMFGGQAISRASDTAPVQAGTLPVVYWITGKTWGWANTEPYVFLGNAAIPPLPPNARLIYRKPPPAAPGAPKARPIR